MRCKEVLIVRDPYKKYGACLNRLKNVAKEVFGEHYYIFEDILASDAYCHKPINPTSDFLERCPEECHGLTVEDCIKKTGEFEYKEWCFDNIGEYKYGIEVDCSSGLIYVYYCEG